MGNLQFSEEDMISTIQGFENIRELRHISHEFSNYNYMTGSKLLRHNKEDFFQINEDFREVGGNCNELLLKLKKSPKNEAIISQLYVALNNFEKLYSLSVEKVKTDDKLFNSLESIHRELTYFLNKKFSKNFQRDFYIFNQDLDIFYKNEYGFLEPDRNIELDIDIDETLETKKDYVLNVVKLIVDNALFHAFPGDSVQHNIILSGKPLEGEFYQISVSNDGKQIPIGNLERIFENGFTTRKEKQNHGFGLWYVRNFIEENGGSINVESSQEETSFRFTIPCIERSKYYYVQK